MQKYRFFSSISRAVHLAAKKCIEILSKLSRKIPTPPGFGEFRFKPLKERKKERRAGESEQKIGISQSAWIVLVHLHRVHW